MLQKIFSSHHSQRSEYPCFLSYLMTSILIFTLILWYVFLHSDFAFRQNAWILLVISWNFNLSFSKFFSPFYIECFDIISYIYVQIVSFSRIRYIFIYFEFYDKIKNSLILQRVFTYIILCCFFLFSCFYFPFNFGLLSFFIFINNNFWLSFIYNSISSNYTFCNLFI